MRGGRFRGDTRGGRFRGGGYHQRNYEDDEFEIYRPQFDRERHHFDEGPPGFNRPFRGGRQMRRNSYGSEDDGPKFYDDQRRGRGRGRGGYRE